MTKVSAKPKITVAQYLSAQIDMSGKSQKQIAEEIGYPKPNVITMFKQGATKLPVNKVYPMARALNVDPLYLMRLVMKEYLPETWDALEQIMGQHMTSEGEREVVEIFRKQFGNQDISIDNDEERDIIRGAAHALLQRKPKGRVLARA